MNLNKIVEEVMFISTVSTISHVQTSLQIFVYDFAPILETLYSNELQILTEL